MKAGNVENGLTKHKNRVLSFVILHKEVRESLNESRQRRLFLDDEESAFFL
jgi:hypothetical protein